MVSRIYGTIQASKNHSTIPIKQKWERESETQISEETWIEICKKQATTANSRLLREFGWKNIVRFFITPKITALKEGYKMVSTRSYSTGQVVWDHEKKLLYGETYICFKT